MKIPAFTGIIRRRILLNFRADPEWLEGKLPEVFRPKLVDGWAIVGICLIRLEEIRPLGFPRQLGISSENAAHRIAVEWDGGEGVYIPRRDTDSRINAFAGGRLFPGVHHHTSFQVTDGDGRISLRAEAKDYQKPLVALETQETNMFPTTSVFSDLEASSEFFRAGSIGYSSRPSSCVLDGLRLETKAWKVTPLEVLSWEAAWLEYTHFESEGRLELDHALLMRDIPHEWHAEPEIRLPLSQEVRECIKTWARIGFYDREEILEIICDHMYKRELDRSQVSKALHEEQILLEAEKDLWPEKTDFERLRQAFSQLRDHGIIAIHNAGFTQSDGHATFEDEYLDSSGSDEITGYCFYHLQDIQHAIEGLGLYIAYDTKSGYNEDDREEIGATIVRVLQAEGLHPQWSGSSDFRILLPDFKWQYR